MQYPSKLNVTGALPILFLFVIGFIPSNMYALLYVALMHSKSSILQNLVIGQEGLYGSLYLFYFYRTLVLSHVI